jgi:bacteriocin-like protein
MEIMMENIHALTNEEMAEVIGGSFPRTETDPQTGETVTYDCTGREISRSSS